VIDSWSTRVPQLRCPLVVWLGSGGTYSVANHMVWLTVSSMAYE
jgi:hypothetical protein